jgi:hypothetical protein
MPVELDHPAFVVVQQFGGVSDQGWRQMYRLVMEQPDDTSIDTTQ